MKANKECVTITNKPCLVIVPTSVGKSVQYIFETEEHANKVKQAIEDAIDQLGEDASISAYNSENLNWISISKGIIKIEVATKE